MHTIQINGIKCYGQYRRTGKKPLCYGGYQKNIFPTKVSDTFWGLNFKCKSMALAVMIIKELCQRTIFRNMN